MRYTLTRSQLIKEVGCKPRTAGDWIEKTFSKYFRYKRDGKNVWHDPFDVFILAFINNQRILAGTPIEKVKESLETLDSFRDIKAISDRFMENYNHLLMKITQ